MLLHAALEYAAQGLAVFPLHPGSKRPANGNGNLGATTDLEQIRAWWGAMPDANIGIDLESSSLIALDVDTADGKPGLASLAEFDTDLPRTRTSRTGRGGLHAVFKRPPDMPPVRLIGFRPGLDLLGKGYILAAPSCLTGEAFAGASPGATGAYAWIDPSEPFATLPPVLVGVAPKDRATGTERASRGVSEADPLPQGGRNNALFRLAASLRDTGIGYKAIAVALIAENDRRCVPPLPESEVLAIAGSAARLAPSRDVAAGAQFLEALIAPVEAPAPTEGPIDIPAAMVALAELAPLASSVALVPPKPTKTYPTGFPTLDRHLGGGLITRQVCGIIGPPSVGKSGFVGVLALNLCALVPMILCSTELPKDELVVRLGCAILGIPWRDGLQGKVSRDDLVRALEGKRIHLIGADDIVRDGPIEAIDKAVCAMWDAYGEPPGLIVDYVQLLARGSDDARSAVGELTMKLRILAQGRACVVVAVLSTSRAFYGASTKGRNAQAITDPTYYLGAAKESGDVEFDCATLLYLDVDQTADGPIKPARIVVARCRIGEVGFVGARFHGAPGIWKPDDSALDAFDPAELKAKELEKTILRVDLDIIEALGQPPGYMSGDDLEKAVTGKNDTIREGIKRLIRAGSIERAEIIDPITRKALRGGMRIRLVKAGNADEGSGVK